MSDRRCVDELTLEELEHLVLIKRRQLRQQRLQRLVAHRRVNEKDLVLADELPAVLSERVINLSSAPPTSQAYPTVVIKPSGAQRASASPQPGKMRRVRDRVLLAVEILILVALVTVFVNSYQTLHTLNQEVTMARAASQEVIAPTPTPLVNFDRLPGGHTPPNSANGAMPDVPLHLQKWVQPAPAQPLPAPRAGRPTRIVIPAIGVDAPIVEGVGWEDLKKGAGHLPGSANPGERGNMYIAAHNDIFGEIFRHLDRLELGDEFFVYSGDEAFRYVVTTKRVIDPSDVSVMYPTTQPIATLQTCYPYLVDSHRLVVIGELAR